MTIVAIGCEQGGGDIYSGSLPREFVMGGALIMSISTTSLLLITYLLGGSQMQKTVFVSFFSIILLFIFLINIFTLKNCSNFIM